MPLSPRHGALACAFALCLLAGRACAQAPALPDPGALPQAPVNAPLPGVDSRQCGTTRWSALCASGRWAQFAALDLTARTTGFTGTYRLEEAANGELHATYREDAHGNRRSGEGVLFGIDGIAYRTRDPLPPADAIIDYLFSSPLMMGRLVAVLLDQGVLEAPADVTAPRTIRAGSKTQFIRADAPRIATLYGPPWSMTGTVKPAGDGRLAFSLTLRFRPVDAKGVPVPGKTDTLQLDGTVSFGDRRPQLPDTMDLVGWKVMKRDAHVAPASTLAEARAAVGN
ncbi:MAG: hypothetical protein U1F48_07180 [Burkholderiales bacterium]